MDVYSELMSQLGNFRNYRQKLSQTTPPRIPFLGFVEERKKEKKRKKERERDCEVYCSDYFVFRCTTKDLLFTQDGNPNMINGAINISKIAKLS